MCVRVRVCVCTGERARAPVSCGCESAGGSSRACLHCYRRAPSTSPLNNTPSSMRGSQHRVPAPEAECSLISPTPSNMGARLPRKVGYLDEVLPSCGRWICWEGGRAVFRRPCHSTWTGSLGSVLSRLEHTRTSFGFRQGCRRTSGRDSRGERGGERLTRREKGRGQMGQRKGKGEERDKLK